jgi:hypothetical protein
MLLSKSITDELKADVRKNPLAEGEVRRVVGMGEMYFSKVGTKISPDFEFSFSMKMHGVEYQFFNRTRRTN